MQISELLSRKARALPERQLWFIYIEMEFARTRIIDCDIHPSASEANPIAPFIPPAFRQAVAFRQASSRGGGYANPFGVDRRDASCGSYEELKEQHLDRLAITYGLLQSPGMKASMIFDATVANGMAQAWNDWTIETYLERDPRLLGSISVNMNDPEAAVKEIHRVAGHPQMVQVLVSGESRELYGHRIYDPVYEACAEHGLVFSLHPGSEGSLRSSTPVGWPSTYLEWHTTIPLTFQAHLISMLCEGTFEKFPVLKLLLTEGGIAWLPHVLWRLDKNYKALRATIPWLKERPSEVALRHVRLSTQPIEEPDKPQHLLQIFDMVRADETVCFATDFPHWDFDAPDQAFPKATPPELLERILYGNAAELFGLDDLKESKTSPEKKEMTVVA